MVGRGRGGGGWREGAGLAGHGWVAPVGQSEEKYVMRGESSGSAYLVNNNGRSWEHVLSRLGLPQLGPVHLQAVGLLQQEGGVGPGPADGVQGGVDTAKKRRLDAVLPTGADVKGVP